MDTPIFAADANLNIDNPLLFAGRQRLEMLLATGAIHMIAAPGYKRAAQYRSNRRAYVPKDQPSDVGFCNAALLGGPKPWAKLSSGGMEVMQQTNYFVMSRHFTQTRRGLNFAPNETNTLSDHKDRGARA